MLPNPHDEIRRRMKILVIITLATLYVVVAYSLWHYAFYG